MRTCCGSSVYGCSTTIEGVYPVRVDNLGGCRYRVAVEGSGSGGIGGIRSVNGDTGPDVSITPAGIGALPTTGGTIDGDLAVTGELSARGLTDWYNAKSYGALGDGETDDITVLQAAVDAIPLGGVLYIPNGDYRISKPLYVKPGITVEMPHANLMAVPGITDVPCRIKPLPGFDGPAAIIFLDQPTGAFTTIPAEHRLNNVMLDGSGHTDTPVDGLQAKGNIQNVVMRGCTIRYMSGNGIYTDINAGAFPYSWRLYRVMSDNNAGHGFSFAVMTDITMFDCQAIGNHANGFNLRNLANSQMTLCRSEWNGNHGYLFTGDWGTGWGAGALVATGCSTDRNGFDGIHIDATGTPPIVFNGLMLRRDGRNNNAGGAGYAGFATYGTTMPVVVSGLTCYTGTDDGGAGTPSPEIGVNVQNATAVFILDDAFIQAAATPLHDDGTNGRVQIGPSVVTATGPTDAPVIDPTTPWGWAGTATGRVVQPTDNLVESHVLGEAYARAVLRADGLLVLGDGSTAPDTPGWYREKAGNLKTDTYVVMEAGGQSGGPFRTWSGEAKALVAGTPGGGLAVAEGDNARLGMSTLAAGTVEVPNTSVSADTRIFLQRQAGGGDIGDLTYAKTPGTGFTVTSSSPTDTSVVEWLLVEKA